VVPRQQALLTNFSKYDILILDYYTIVAKVYLMTNAELAILSLVVEQPRHGYEIEQVIEERGMRDWTEVGFSSIYYLLKKLEREGFVAGQLQEAERGPARKVYRATPAGEEAYHAGVLDVLSVPRRWYSPLLLGLAGLPRVPRGDAVAALQQYREALAARRTYVQGRRERQRPLPGSIDAMFEYSVALIGAELEWVEGFSERLEGEDDQD
jgi:DNA-binding PadR family transcriptional regulator